MDQMFAEMDDLAAENVKAAIANGDAKVSMWYLELRAKTQGTRLQKGLLKPLIDAVDTLEDAELISKQALLLAIDGDMSFEQLKAIQEAVARHATLSGMIELKRLREELETIRSETGAAAPSSMGHAPSWGRLKAAEDAEDAEEVTEPAPRPNGKANGANGKTNGKATSG